MTTVSSPEWELALPTWFCLSTPHFGLSLPGFEAVSAGSSLDHPVFVLLLWVVPGTMVCPHLKSHSASVQQINSLKRVPGVRSPEWCICERDTREELVAFKHFAEDTSCPSGTGKPLWARTCLPSSGASAAQSKFLYLWCYSAQQKVQPGTSQRPSLKNSQLPPVI